MTTRDGAREISGFPTRRYVEGRGITREAGDPVTTRGIGKGNHLTQATAARNKGKKRRPRLLRLLRRATSRSGRW